MKENYSGFTLFFSDRGSVPALINPLLQEALKQNGVSLIDAGNIFNPYVLANYMAANKYNPRPILEKLSIQRAFTCYQVESLISDLDLGINTLVLLAPLLLFKDDSVRISTRQRLLISSLRKLRRLRKVFVFEYNLNAPDVLVKLLRQYATVIEEKKLSPCIEQMRLF